MKYENVKLSEVLQPKGYIRGPFGSALKRGELQKSGIPVYEQQHAITNCRTFRFYIGEEKYKELKRFTVQPNDIIISCSGTIGKISIITESDPIGIISQALLILRCNTDIILPRYLYYFLISAAGFHSITSVSSGSVQVNIAKRAVIENIDIPYCSLDIQGKIVSILSSLDSKIELNQKINTNLERQAQAIFKSWFVDFEPFGGEIPANWEWLKFSSFLTTSNEKSNDLSLPMFSVTDQGIFPRDEKFKKKLSMTNSKNKVVHQTDLVFGMSREILNWGIMRHSIGGVSAAYNVYQVSDQINTFYLESYMKANYQYFRDLIKPASREGQGIDKNALMQKVILIPSEDVLEKYYHIESALVRMSKHVLEDSERLAAIRDTLLPKLMSGEIDVSTIHH